MTGALCSAKLRSSDPCRSVATRGEFCAYHAVLAGELGNDVVANSDQRAALHGYELVWWRQARAETRSTLASSGS